MPDRRLNPVLVFLVVAFAYASPLAVRLANGVLAPGNFVPLLVFALSLTAVALSFRFSKFAGDAPTATLLMLLSGLGIVMQFRIGTLRMDGDVGLASFAFPLGVAVMLGVWALFRHGRYERLLRAWLPCLVLAVLVLLVIILTGRRYRGAVYAQGNMNPSEVVKPLLIVFLAAALTGHQASLRRGWGPIALPRGSALLTLAILWAPPMALLLWQGDIGMVSLLCAVALVMLYGMSHRFGYLLLAATGAFLAIRFLIPLSSHAVKRFSAWADPFSQATAGGWQILQGLVALYSGGLLGLGVGVGNPSAVPISESDFIYAVIGEELGYVGCGLVILLYIVLTVRGFGIAARAPSPFGASLATGVTACVALQALLNIGGVTKAIPLTGITLPFISHGGSSIVTLFAMAGLLLAVSDSAPAEIPSDIPPSDGILFPKGSKPPAKRKP